MSGMGDGYVGTSQDAVRIRRLEKQREAERRKIQDLKNKTASTQGQPGLLQFGSSTSEILETAFKKETVGLVTREEYVEKRVNIRSKIEEEEKEKLQKLQQEEEELQAQKRQKRKIKENPRLSFSDDIENGSEEDEGENKSKEAKRIALGKFGKDPTVETSFLPDSEREAEEQAERERLRKQWLREQEQIRNEPLQITYSYWDGAGHRRVLQVRKGDSIGVFLRAVQQQLAPEFREIRTTSVENLLYVKEDLIIPHLFHFDVHEDVRTIADATKEKDEIVTLSPTRLQSHAGKVVERHWFEKNKHIFPASRWENVNSMLEIYTNRNVDFDSDCAIWFKANSLECCTFRVIVEDIRPNKEVGAVYHTRGLTNQRQPSDTIAAF
ncbi:XAP5 family protein [Actinidia rufa]|uniref:XAP5 family protein n=1 Tax=Actinidia rufa TaxID=165716 RepID=A0A7J0DUJ9_9ERIC|nr:XAP5 family protein [Actinidia rufa]